ncbi:hypothetical protein V8F20_012320 [Naviculisporaceae sp. PSN 640]
MLLFELATLLGSLFLASVRAELFAFENVRLAESDIGNFSAISFANSSARQAHGPKPRCNVFPGDKNWPSVTEWNRLNASLDGALLRPEIPGAACYPSEPTYDPERCRFLVQQAGRTHFWLDNPLTTLTQWPQGNTCLPSLNLTTTANCARGGWPEYVVNATTVKHIQVAINFARNKNIRLVIKNTGHDFGGRSMGAGSLSVWVHNLKSFEFIPEYKSAVYSGMAVRIGAGVESWEMFGHMADSGNITVVAPGGSTVGSVGGWLAAGGHGALTSKYGLGADQALEINVVTADGRFLTASSEENQELFWALRGGGPSTYGIMTSVVLKAYPPLKTISVSIAFSINQPPTLPPNLTNTLPGGFLPPYNPATNLPVTEQEKFWEAIKLTYQFGTPVLLLGGFTYNYIYPLGNNSFSFTTSHSIPDISPEGIVSLHKPLFLSLNRLGINVTLTTPRVPTTFYGSRRASSGTASPAQTRYRSRLFPRENWISAELYNQTWDAIRKGVAEGGYTFHGIGYSPSLAIAGTPGNNSAVNPAWRETVLHASLMELQPVNLTPAQARERDAKAKYYLDMWREVTPGSGAYLNEGDPAEPDWQRSFFGGGERYRRLLAVKKRYDPWGVFWARTTVGSEDWEVVPVDGEAEDLYPFSQNGRLCRVVN